MDTVDGAASLPNVNLVFIGHVDAGKSTICGHILYLLGNLDKRTLEKYEREAKAIGRESWKFAWALDTTDEERAKGKTQECGRGSFSTKARRYTILDAPGHKNFVPHMIGGACQAEIAVLVISAKTGEFEAGFDKGGQSREHAILAKTMGVRHLVVAVNKLDEVAWDQRRYDDIVARLTPFLKQVGFSPATELAFVPIDGLHGANLLDRVTPAVCPWYAGPSLLEAVDAVALPRRSVGLPLRVPVSDRFREADCFILGKVESGRLRVGDDVVVMPGQASRARARARPHTQDTPKNTDAYTRARAHAP